MLQVKDYEFWFVAGSQHLYGEEQLNNVFSGVSHFKRICKNLHPIFAWRGTSCRKSLLTNQLHYANPAVACNTKVFVVAESRDDYSCILCCIQNRDPFLNLQGLSVYGYFQFLSHNFRF